MLNDMLTDSEIAEIRARCRRATPGPWHCSYENEPVPAGMFHPDTPREMAEAWYDGLRAVQVGPIEGSEVDRYTEALNITANDAEFIAHAREDLPRALDTIEEMVRLIWGTGGEPA